MGVWKIQEWTNQHDVARVDIAGVDNAAPCGRGRQCRSGLIGTVWQGGTMREKKTYPSKLNVRVKNVNIDFVHPCKTEIMKQTQISNY